MKIQPTDVERLILAQQHEILAALYPHNSKYHLGLAENLFRGHDVFYEGAHYRLQPVIAADEKGIVGHALSLFRAMQRSFFDAKEKGSLKEENFSWPGFDKNQETTMYQLTQAFYEQSLYVELMRNGAVDSGIQMRSVYERMLSAWASIGDPQQMTLEQLEMIVAARRHPDV